MTCVIYVCMCEWMLVVYVFKVDCAYMYDFAGLVGIWTRHGIDQNDM